MISCLYRQCKFCAHVLFFTGDETIVVAEEETCKRPVIIQVSEGLGNAVFSLAHIDLLTHDETMKDQDFDVQSLDLLRQSSDARINMLSQILKLLGMTCLPLKVPELTPIFLLANKLVSLPVLYLWLSLYIYLLKCEGAVELSFSQDRFSLIGVFLT